MWQQCRVSNSEECALCAQSDRDINNCNKMSHFSYICGRVSKIYSSIKWFDRNLTYFIVLCKEGVVYSDVMVIKS